MIETGIIKTVKTSFEYYISGNYLYVNNLPQNALLHVYNLQGIKIQEARTNGEQASIALSQKGIYILNIITAGEVFSVKIIK